MVSVVVPVYNVGPYAVPCLESLAAQTFRDFEAIVVDDGSSDGSAEAAERFAARDSRFRVVRTEHGGLAAARNAGTALAGGEWISFLDSDDLIAPDFLAALLDAAARSDADVACCGKLPFFGEPPRVPGPDGGAVETVSGTEAAARSLYQSDDPDYSAWGKIYSSRLWAGRRFPARKRFEDMALIPSVLAESPRVAFSGRKLYLYRKRSSGLLATALSSGADELLDIAEGLVRWAGDPDSVLAAAARSNLLSACFSVFLRAPRTEENAAVRDAAFRGIVRLRGGVLRDSRARFKNRAACLASFAGRKFLETAAEALS